MGKKSKSKLSRPTKAKAQPIEQKHIPFWQKLIPPTIISMLTTTFYYKSLSYPFQFDDLANITKKFNIRYANPLKKWWTNRRWMGEWLNRMNFDLGRFDPFYYRLTNLVIHIITGVFVFLIILEGCSKLKKRPFFQKNALFIASTVMALFLLHPVQTQAISYVIQARLEGLATLFVVAALFFFMKAFQTNKAWLRYPLAAISVTIAFFSCGTKEIAIVSPLLAILIDWFFLAEEEWASFKSRLWFHAIYSFTVFATFYHYFSPKFISDVAKLKFVAGNNRGNILTKHAHDVIRPLGFLISEFKVILHYLAMFIWPFSISVEYDWKMCENFFSPDSFFPFMALLGLFFLAVYSLYKKKGSFFGIGFLWFLIAVLPRSSIIPSPELVCDYKTYLGSIGWIFVLSTCFVAATNYIISKVNFFADSFNTTSEVKNNIFPQFASLCLVSLLTGYGAMQRNIVWSSPIEFWQDITIKAPLKARGHNNLGVALSESERFDEAIPCYLEAIRLDRNYSDPWSNLAVAYSVKGKVDKAIGALKQAIKIFPNYPEAYNNLGTLMIKKKNYDAAEKILLTALKIRPYYGKAFYNLGRLYMEKGDLEKSWEYFEKATQGDLDTTEGFFTLGQMSLKLKKYENATKAFSMALRRGKNLTVENSRRIRFNLANSYFMIKEYDKALSMYLSLNREEPNNHKYLYNLAEIYFSKQDFSTAAPIFKRLSQPPLGIAHAAFRYAHCQEKMKNFEEAKKILATIRDSEKVPKDLKISASREIGRLTIQAKLNKGNCTLTASELQKAFAYNKSKKAQVPAVKENNKNDG